MMSNSKFSNNIALVTGSTRGIGKAIATLLAKQGAIVYINSRTNSEGIALERIFRKQGLKIHYIQGDISCIEDVRAIFDTIKREQGRVDILVNNAGIFYYDSSDYTVYNVLHKINGYGVYLCCSLASTYMKNGKIINISSIYGVSPNPDAILASGVKAEVDCYTKAFAKKYLGKIQVNAIAPGYTDTSLLQNHFGKKEITKIIERIPLQRLLKPYEVAGMVSLLLANETISGQTLVIDGGYLLNQAPVRNP